MVQPASASAVVVLIDDSALCLLDQCYVSANGDTHTHTHAAMCVHMQAQTEWLWWAGLVLTYHLLHHIIFHSARQQQQQQYSLSPPCSLASYVSSLLLESNWLLKTGSALAGRKSSRRDFPLLHPQSFYFWQIECQRAFRALSDRLLDAHRSKKTWS